MLVRVFGFVRCIITLKGNPYVGMFEEVGNFSYFWAVICECCPFFVVSIVIYVRIPVGFLVLYLFF